MKRKLYVDMDGVAADFDVHYQNTFGITSSKEKDDVDWDAIRAIDDWFLNMPPMPDFHELWAYVEKFSPTFLTGVPKEVGQASNDKRGWISKHVGDHVPVITCRSREKCLHANPGDILIDDWEKHKQKWIDVGGTWITHTSAAESIRQLKEHGFISP